MTQRAVAECSLPQLRIRITWKTHPPMPRRHPDQPNQNPQVTPMWSQGGDAYRRCPLSKAQLKYDLLPENFLPISLLFIHPTQHNESCFAYNLHVKSSEKKKSTKIMQLKTEQVFICWRILELGDPLVGNLSGKLLGLQVSHSSGGHPDKWGSPGTAQHLCVTDKHC